MALSNWDTFAVTHEGKPCHGNFTSPGGVSVEFYKNWLYVRDPKAWQAGSGWAEPTVMHIQECHLTYKDVQILAWRGPQGGIYAVVWTSGYYYGAKDDPNSFNARGMIGCGVYGYEDTVAKVLAAKGRSAEYNDDWLAGSSSYRDGNEVKFQSQLTNYKTGETIPHDLETEWEGVRPDSIEYFEKLLVKHADDLPDFAKNMNILRGGQRFNQGDAYFAGKTGGLLDVQATAPGEPKEPHITKIIDAMKDVTDDPES